MGYKIFKKLIGFLFLCRFVVGLFIVKNLEKSRNNLDVAKQTFKIKSKYCDST